MRNLLDRKLLKFLLIGIIITLIGLTLNFVMFQVAKLGYWLSTSVSTLLCAGVSFLLNKKFTFGYKRDWIAPFIRFAVSQAISYIVAYKVAQPLVTYVLEAAEWSELIGYKDHIAILVGMCLFTAMNYTSQRMFVFTSANKEG